MTIGQNLDILTGELANKIDTNSERIHEIGLKTNEIDLKINVLRELLAKQDEKIKILENGKKFKNIIMYPGTNFNTIAGGATSVFDNVQAGLWSWKDVEKYDFCSFSHLDYAAGSFSDILFNKMREVAKHTTVLTNLRHDLFYMYHERGWNESADMIPLPAIDWGEKPLDGIPWEKAVKKMENAGYRPANYRADSYSVSFPYQITLENGVWSIRNAVMQVNNLGWAREHAKHLVGLRKRYPEISGYYVNTPKLQKYVPGRRHPRQFHEWIEGTENFGWDLATNLGGSETWPRAGDTYDDYTSDMFDCIAGSFTFAKELRSQDPGAIIVYSGDNLYINSWRTPYYKSLFIEAFLKRFPNGDAIKWWKNNLLNMKNYANYVEFPEDDHPEDFSKEWADSMRSSQWLKKPSHPQDIAKV
jgi:hypothetical protein